MMTSAAQIAADAALKRNPSLSDPETFPPGDAATAPEAKTSGASCVSNTLAPIELSEPLLLLIRVIATHNGLPVETQLHRLIEFEARRIGLGKLARAAANHPESLVDKNCEDSAVTVHIAPLPAVARRYQACAKQGKRP